jgi:hypothetical protein
MKMTRTVLLGLAFLMPALSVAKAADEKAAPAAGEAAPAGEAKAPKKAKKAKKEDKKEEAPAPAAEEKKAK